jgi:uncharacterized protein (DUF4415 family)
MARARNLKGPDKGDRKRTTAKTIVPPTAAEDEHINRGIASDPDTFEWTAQDFARARPVAEAFPDLAEHSIKRRRGQRGPQKAPTKKPIKLRVDPDVLAWYQSTGPRWQTRINEVLRRDMEKHH